MREGTLRQALPIVAAAYGRKFGVKVLVGGTQACTNSQVIVIPDLVDTPEAKLLAWGYLGHEAAHVRYTDFDAWTRIASTGGLVTKLLGDLEDVRIELAMAKPYPGTRSTIAKVIDWMIQAGRLSPPQIGQAPGAILDAYILLSQRYRVLGQASLKGAAQEAEKVLRQTFPASFVHRLMGMLTEVRGLSSTQEAADLAQRIVALIGEETQPPQPPPEQGDDDQGLGEDGAGEDDPTDSEDGDAEDDGPTQGQSGEGEDDDPAAGEEEDPAARQALQALLRADGNDFPEDTFAAVAQELSGEAAGGYVPKLPVIEEFDGNPTVGQQFLAAVKGESAKLQARLQGLVEAHRMDHYETRRRGRLLDPRHLHRVAVGDDRMFQRRDHRVAPNTAIHLVLDLSGSMSDPASNGKILAQIALASTLALALALEPMRGVSVAASAFPGLKGTREAVVRILSHGDRVADRAGAFVMGPRGCTPMTGALWYAAADLMGRQEDRKIILVLTDGQPDDPQTAAEMIRKAVAGRWR